MDWDRYKALCDTPDVCSRWLLDQTCELVDDPDLAARLRDGARAAQLPKPADHRGGPETDMFRLSLHLDEVRRLCDAVRRAEQRGATTSAGRGLGGFIETWEEYARFLQDKGGAADCSPRS